MSNIGTETVGQRVYVTGNSYPIKDQLKSAGCHWDGERKQWWIGSGKADAIRAIVAAPDVSPSVSTQTATADCDVIGKAVYKGRKYYVRWQGVCKNGAEKFRLVTLNGKIDFWTDAAITQWEKQYQSPKSLSGIRRYIERLRDPKFADREAGRRQTGGICRCSHPIDEGDGECMTCGYYISGDDD